MQLHSAAARGDLAGMAFALENGTDVNARNSQKETALVFALNQAKAFERWRGPKVSTEAIRFLAEAGADLTIPDSLGETAIHKAAAIPDSAIIESLLACGADPRHVTSDGYSVLTHACYRPAGAEKLEILRRLRQENAPLDVASRYGEFPLGTCLYFGDFEALRLLLELGADPTPLNWTRLHQSVALEDVSTVSRFTTSSTEINTLNARYGLSPWLLAFVRGDLGIVQLLADRGADLTHLGRCGESLLHIAARFGHADLIKWLLDMGATPNAANEFAGTALHEAAEWDRFECVGALLNCGADSIAADHVQCQPIHRAKSLAILRVLVEQGHADVNAIDGCGEWPLKLAADDNDVARINWLLQDGAHVDLTSTGETALHEAVRADSREAVEALLTADANPNQQDVDGWTPLFLAKSRETIFRLRKAGADAGAKDQIGAGPGRWLDDPLLISALTEPL